MKKLLVIILLFYAGNTVFSQKNLNGNIIQKPNPQKLVTDYANVLLPEQVEILEQQLVALDDNTSNQIAIVTIATLGDRSIEDVAVATFRDWGIGNKTSRNGVLILVAVEDHKMRIEVGYGLEGVIPDVTANDIIDNDLAPNFKQENYYQGFQLAIESLSKAAIGEYNVRREKGGGSDGGSILGVIIIGIIIIMIVGNSGGKGGGGGMVSRRGSGWLTPFILGNLLGGGGRGGSDWGGGGGGGFGGGGGGFGGFGGGGSGGGGASGSW